MEVIEFIYPNDRKKIKDKYEYTVFIKRKVASLYPNPEEVRRNISPGNLYTLYIKKNFMNIILIEKKEIPLHQDLIIPGKYSCLLKKIEKFCFDQEDGTITLDFIIEKNGKEEKQKKKFNLT
ncbi:MAG: hypothetical protein NZ889_01335 [Candidatus Pacearchaeota archaeon]|nr:hypothetical protein [Candidatus Pacearchaeota archaeon]